MNEKNYLRLIAAMIAEMHQQADVDDGVNSKLVASALWNKQDWAILWEHDWLLEGEENPPAVSYVVDVLDMWRFIETVYEQLPQPEKDRLAAEVPYGAGNNPRFGGFDGNNEGRYMGITRMLVESMGRFDEFKGRDLNTHSPTDRRYGAMLRAWEEAKAKNGSEFYRTSKADDLISILMAPYRD